MHVEDLRDRWGLACTCCGPRRARRPSAGKDATGGRGRRGLRRGSENGGPAPQNTGRRPVEDVAAVWGGDATLEQAHTSNRAEYERLEELGLPEQRARELVDKALAARSLVRVKVADDTYPCRTLLACGELRFFDDLEAHARREGAGAFYVFATRSIICGPNTN